MKRVVVLALLALLVSSLTFGQEKRLTHEQQGAKVSESIASKEHDLARELVKGDTALFERYLDDTFTVTLPDAGMQDRAQLIAILKSGDLKYESSQLDELKVRVYGDTAVATYRATNKGTYKTQDVSGQERWLDVWVKRGADWKQVASQGTTIPPK